MSKAMNVRPQNKAKQEKTARAVLKELLVLTEAVEMSALAAVVVKVVQQGLPDRWDHEVIQEWLVVRVMQEIQAKLGQPVQ